MDFRLTVVVLLLAGLLVARYAMDAQSEALGGVIRVPLIDHIAQARARRDPAVMPIGSIEPAAAAGHDVDATIPPPPTPNPHPPLQQVLADPALAMMAAEPAAGPAPVGGVLRQPSAIPGVQGTPTQTVRRRDPLDLPLDDEQVWFEWILSVAINGRPVTEGAIVIENRDNGRLAITREQALRWRLLFDDDDVISFQGEPFLPLDRIGGAEVTFDRTELAIGLEIPASRFEGFELDLEARDRPVPTASNGFFLDYDLLLNAGEAVSNRVDGLLEAGAFSEFGVITNSMQLNDIGSDDFEAVRLETAITRDFPADRRTIRLGDSLSVGGELSRGVRFAGLQWGSNFAVDPTFVSFPTPAIGGLADQDSVVDVIVDNISRATRDVPPGPFSITNVPVVSGRGEVQLRVTDLLGRETIVTQPYYVSSRLLKTGLHDFSYALGVEREDFGSESFDYDRLIATAFHRKGLSDELTVDGYGEATAGTVMGSGGAVFKVGNFGLVSGSVGLSGDDDDGAGFAGGLVYEFSSGNFNLSARTQYFSEDFRSIAVRDENLRRVDQFNVGLTLGDFGRIGLLFLNRHVDGRADNRSLAASYGVPIGPGSLIIRAGQTLNPDQETAITASYAMSLGPSRSLTTEIDHQNDDTRGRMVYRRGRGASDIGLDYRIAAEAGDSPRRYDARVGYTASLAAGSIDLQRLDGENNMRGNLSGSVALMDGDLRVSRRLGRAFGLVSVPGYSDVRVYMDNRLVGETDDDGEILVPGLRPYENNRLSFEVDDLPLSASFGVNEKSVTPFDRTGVKVAFDVESLNEVTAHFFDDEGEPLPIGTTLASDDGDVHVSIGRGGFAHIEGDWSARLAVKGARGDRRYRCEIDVPPADEILPDLGDVSCASTPL